MNWKRRWVVGSGLALGLLATGLVVLLLGGDSGRRELDLRVRGTEIVDRTGRPLILRGVNRSGLEYQCLRGAGFFQSPHPSDVDDHGMVEAMRSWRINVVRLPLNADCWLGVGVPPRYSGDPYRQAVMREVTALEDAGLYVILDLQWTAAPPLVASAEVPMADDRLAPAFWSSVAAAFRDDHGVIFDLFNEPYGISWSCWRDGCVVPGGISPPTGLRYPTYRAAGMQRLLDAVRSTGARQPVLIAGLNYGRDLSQWLMYKPRDPAHQLIADEHNYGGLSPCDQACRAAIVAVRNGAPVLLGELGEVDCAHAYVDRMMAWADRLGIGYLGWAWDAGGFWSCVSPSLINSYDGAPTPYGQGLRDHLRKVVPASGV